MVSFLVALVGYSIPAFLIVGLIIVILSDIWQRKEFRKNYPPITDDEFMEKLPPGTSRDVALRVREIVAEQMGVEKGRIHPDTKFVDLM